MNLRAIKYLVVVSLFFEVVSGCKSLKVLPNKIPIKNIGTKELTKALKSSAPELSLLRTRLKVKYNDGKRVQPLVVNLRMEKNKGIWLSANMLIPIAKLLITPNNVQFYEKFQKTSYNGKLSFIKDYFGIDFGYKNLENLLIGKPIIDIKKGKWEQITNPEFYIISPKINSNKYRPIFFFDPETLMLKQQRFIFNGTNRSLIINYDDFQKVDGKDIPSKISLILMNSNSNIEIEVDYTRAEIPENLTFPFKIPKGYSSIKF